MKKILITGAGSYIGTSFEKYMEKFGNDYSVDTVDMIGDSWKSKSFSGYDCVFHVAGIAHSDNGKISKEKEKLYYAVNTDLTVETAKNPTNSITADIRNLTFTLSFLLMRPPANPPRQKKIIEIVNVSDIWEIDQSGKISPSGVLKMDHA